MIGFLLCLLGLHDYQITYTKTRTGTWGQDEGVQHQDHTYSCVRCHGRVNYEEYARSVRIALGYAKKQIGAWICFKIGHKYLPVYEFGDPEPRQPMGKMCKRCGDATF